MNDFSWNNNCINSSDTSLLVIDDDPKDLQLICDLLRGYGLSMLTTHQGSGSLLEQIRDSHPAMILLDTQISGIDAFDICRMLKADETLRHIPVIFLSASSAARERRKVFQHGADDLIFKPIQREEFLAKVITQLSHTCRDITDRKQTEADVRFSEHRFRTILETTDQGFWEINEDGRTMDVNPATCALLGKNRDEIIGHYVTDFLDEKSAEEFIRQMRIRGAGLSSSYELSFHREDGSIVRCMIKETRFFDENGKRAGSFAMLTDITEPRRLEEAHLAQMNFLESLERIDQTLRGATDLDKMLHESMETVQSIFQSDRTWLLYPCDPNAPTYRVPVEHARPEYPGALAMDLDVPMKPGADGVCIDTLGSEDPVTYGPSKSDRPLYKEVMEQFGVLSQMIMAIYPKIGKPWMFGMHQCSHAREWTAHEKRLFKEIGRRIADGLSSTLSLRDLQEREARLQSILGTSPAGIGLVSDRVFLNLNKRICEMVDRSHEELFQQNTRILYPNDREYEAVGEILYGQGQGKGAIETKWIRKEGEIIDVLLTSSPIDPSDLSKGITMIALDITERKRLERIERHANAVTKAIAEASLSYLETGSVETMAQLIVEHASRVIGSQIGILVDLEEEQDVRILAVTAMTWETMKGRDLYNKAREEIEEKGFYSLPFVRNLIFAPMREGVPVISNDPKNHPSWAGRMPEGHPAIESFLGVPMRIGEHLVGLLALANRPGGFSDQQLREAEAFANTAALALRIARSEEERLQVEMQLKQAQKMEAIGQLAGGIAHDFNNLLTSILGYNELVLEGVSADDPLKECLYYIQEAGHRAALLTNQLLAFSRRQLLQPIDLNLNHLIRDLLNLLRRIIQENIELEVIPGHNLGTVHADPNQIEQVLMNVVVNARDAMPEGG
ncbi:MAG: PAS domain S-box protein, partial [Planctomycetota bacterium]